MSSFARCWYLLTLAYSHLRQWDTRAVDVEMKTSAEKSELPREQTICCLLRPFWVQLHFPGRYLYFPKFRFWMSHLSMCCLFVPSHSPLPLPQWINRPPVRNWGCFHQEGTDNWIFSATDGKCIYSVIFKPEDCTTFTPLLFSFFGVRVWKFLSNEDWKWFSILFEIQVVFNQYVNKPPMISSVCCLLIIWLCRMKTNIFHGKVNVCEWNAE